MATLIHNRTSLVPHGSGTPVIAPIPGPPSSVLFTCPGITADGQIVLTGTSGESLNGWVLGYVQLKFIATDYGRYRGAHVKQGSALVTKNNQILCRDTDEKTPEVWYDPIVWGIHFGRGTKALTASSVIPASGEFLLAAIFGDHPGRQHDGQVTNPSTGAPNFLHHSGIELHFCTMLVARTPAGDMLPLKHFYWNVRWEAHFRPDAAGVPVIRSTDLAELNIQHHVHTGLANDKRFKGKEFDMTLPVSNDVSRRPSRTVPVSDWGEG
jgi:hypothetical protein